MNKIVALAAVLLIGPVAGAPIALAQTTTAPNSGAGVPGLPGNTSGPAVSPGQQFIIIPGQSNLPEPLGSKSGPAVQPTTGLQDRAQGNEEEGEEDQGGFFHQQTGMMGMMERGHGQHRGMVGLHIIFALMDADGDGTVSLQEWQAAQERMFKAMDTDHDGTVSFEEMRAFFRGHERIALRAPALPTKIAKHRRLVWRVEKARPASLAARYLRNNSGSFVTLAAIRCASCIACGPGRPKFLRKQGKVRGYWHDQGGVDYPRPAKQQEERPFSHALTVPG